MKKGNIFFVLLLVSQILMISGDYMDKGYRSVFSIIGFVLCIVADIIFLYVYFIGSKKVCQEISNYQTIFQLFPLLFTDFNVTLT